MTSQTAAGTPLKAMYQGYCKACRTGYKAGTMIVRRDGMYVHEACPAEVETVRELDHPETLRTTFATVSKAPDGRCPRCQTWCYGDCGI